MKRGVYRTYYLVLERSKRLIKGCKGYLILFLVLFLLGYLTGIFTAGSYAGDLSCDRLINTYLYSMLTKGMKSFTYFLVLTIYFAIVVLFVAIFTRNIFFIVLDCILMVLMSYIAGFDITIIFVTLGLSGIILGFLTYGIWGVLFFANLSLVFAVSSSISTKRRNCEIKDKGYIRLYFSLFLVGILYLFLISMIFGLIHIFVIVG